MTNPGRWGVRFFRWCLVTSDPEHEARSRAIEEAVREKLDRHQRRRLSAEAKKLSRKEERGLAEEGMTGEETAWPEY